MIRCAEIIDYLHSKEISHGDIKQENLGRDSQGNLKIFDFGMSQKTDSACTCGEYNLNPKQNDIIALGKMFINMLAEIYVMAPGRHYMSDFLKLGQEDLNSIVEELGAGPELKAILLKMLNISNDYDPSLLRAIINELKGILYRT